MAYYSSCRRKIHLFSNCLTLRVKGMYVGENINKINSCSYLTPSAKDRMVDGLSELTGSLQRSGSGNFRWYKN